MLDLDRRLHSLTDAMADGVRLDDPSAGTTAPTQTVELAETALRTRPLHTTRPARRRLAGTGAVLLAAAAVFGVVVWTGSDDVAVVPAVEDAPASSTPVSTADADAAPIEQVRAAFDATLAAPGWTTHFDAETLDGQPLDTERGVHGKQHTTYRAPGLVAVTSQLTDGSWKVTNYFDLSARREYWLVGPDQWKSAAMAPHGGPQPWVTFDNALDGDVCVAATQDGRYLIVNRTTDPAAAAVPCPAVAPPEAEWPTALPGAKLVVALTDDGRVASYEVPMAEVWFEHQDTGVARLTTRFDYDDVEHVELPDPSQVTQVVLPADGTIGYSTITGYSFRGDGPCTEFDQSGCPAG